MTSKKSDEEEEEHNSSNKNNQIEKIKLMEDNASTSQGKSSSHNAGITNIGVRNKKRDNIFEHEGFNKTKQINFLVIFIAIIAIIAEYFYLNQLKKDTNNNNKSYIHFREFSKLYFQLFSSLIGVSCVRYNNSCLILTNIYTENYFGDNQATFNYTILAMIQNDILSALILERKNYLSDIHKCIGDKNYEDIFGHEIKYFRITQSYLNGNINTHLSEINIQFSEALLIICNSFQSLTNITNYPISILNKLENPFSNLKMENIEILNDI
jgi:hypothetical protein